MQTLEKTGNTSLNHGANIVTLAGVGLVVYGVVILVRNFTGFTEPGLTADRVGVTPGQILAFNPNLYNYISHVHMANAGFMIGLGIAVIALAHHGIRREESWALWTAFFSPLCALVIALPLHYSFDLDSLGHLGPVYLILGILLAGTIVSHRAMRA